MNTLVPGTQIGAYIVERELGRGGMGAVYLVRHKDLELLRALKIISVASNRAMTSTVKDHYRRRFLNEAKALVQLSKCDEIIEIYDFAEHDGDPYLLMEYFERSEPLSEWRVALAERGKQPSEAALIHIGRQMAKALAFAHDRKNPIVHRDIKPANVLINDEGRVKLIDFGLARGMADEHMTSQNANVGTIPYFAPEYVASFSKAERSVHTPKTDLWAFGCTLYWLACLQHPVYREGPDRWAVLERGDHRVLSLQRGDLSARFCAVVESLLRPDPSERAESAQLVYERLSGLPVDPAFRLASGSDDGHLSVSESMVAEISPALPAEPAQDATTPGRRMTSQREPSVSASAETTLKNRRPSSEAPTRNMRASSSDSEEESGVLLEDDEMSLEVSQSADERDPESALLSAAIRGEPPTIPPPSAYASEKSATFEDTDETPAPLSASQRDVPTADVPARSKRDSGASQARSRLLAAGLVVLFIFLGGGLFITAVDGMKSSEPIPLASLEQKNRAALAEDELSALKEEKAHQRSLVPPPVKVDSSAEEAPPKAAPQEKAEPRRRRRRAVKAQPRVATREKAEAPSGPPDPWAAYAGRDLRTRSTVEDEDDEAPKKEPAAAAGVRVPARLKTSLTSSPPGPVIAIVTRTTKVGEVTFPKGAELHGATEGISSARLLARFSFLRLPGGKKVPFSGRALARDGRAGLPAARSLGDGSDIVAGAAEAAIAAGANGAAELLGDNPAGAAVQGAASPSAEKTRRMSRSEDAYTVKRGTRLVVYVDRLGA